MTIIENNNFTALADKADAILSETEKSMENSMQIINKEQYDAVMEKTIDVAVDRILSAVKNIRGKDPGFAIDAMFPSLSPILSDFPDVLIDVLLSHISDNEQWKTLCINNAFVSSIVITEIANILAKFRSSRQSKNQEVIQKYAVEISENIFSGCPDFFGAKLTLNVEMTLNGNSGDYAGECLLGGTLIITGNAGTHTGQSMKNGRIDVLGDARSLAGKKMKNGRITIGGNAADRLGEFMFGGAITVMKNSGDNTGHYLQNGKITVLGNSGKRTGEAMVGGILDIKGEIESFGYATFINGNMGKIIWKGVTIWKNGKWTPIGREIDAAGKIPRPE